MFSGYLKTKKITEELALNLLTSRNSYNYPNVKLVASSQPTEFKIDENLWATPEESNSALPTDINLDNYHHNLLTSKDASENLLGTASVIFWGFYTFKRNYALNKLRWHLQGSKFKVASTPDLIHQKLRLVQSESNQGKALMYLKDVSQLGSIPFASKILAFINPNLSGIYDNQIHAGLLSTDWYHYSGLDTCIGQVHKRTVQDGYTRWCSFLQEIAIELNKGIASGKDWKWKDYSGGAMTWRALDVERALFYFFKTNRSK